MRADRLLSLLMLLQTRGRLTARELAERLEVSERTIYRDLEALSAAGVPVFADRGPGGGCGLLDGYRTTLTGLTEAEARALFMVSLPASLGALGVSQDLRSALLKLTAALPPGRRAAEAETRQRLHIDASWWFQPAGPAPCLPALHAAVWQDQRLRLTVRGWGGPAAAPLTAEVEPYGLAAKAGVWHLVYARAPFPAPRLHVDAAADILAAEPTGTRFERPAAFDLAEFWRQWCEDVEHSRPRFVVRARVAPEVWPRLSLYLGEGRPVAIAAEGPADAAGWTPAQLTFEHFEEARARLLGLGGAIEVRGPEALRRSLADFAAQALAVYAR
ncbi:MAG: WYL domain-containing protein [Anaerolineales bacterium]|nr:WYL domain-containing protein [Anaerolineales bacterium]